jgi:sigma54-dependent transcription regulator
MKKELSIYAIEDKIHAAWNFKEDIELIIDFVLSDNTDPEYEERLISMLRGVKEIYHLRFEKLFEIYEKYLQQEFQKKNRPYQNDSDV